MEIGADGKKNMDHGVIQWIWQTRYACRAIFKVMDGLSLSSLLVPYYILLLSYYVLLVQRFADYHTLKIRLMSLFVSKQQDRP